MLEMKWKKTQGTQTEKPSEVDKTSSPTTVYVRKNIERVQLQGSNGDSYSVWQYDEMQIAVENYWQYEELQAQLESPAMQALKEENAALMLGMADLYEQTALAAAETAATMAATMAGLAEIYETILMGVEV